MADENPTADELEIRELALPSADHAEFAAAMPGPEVGGPELSELELARWYNARLTRLLEAARARIAELEVPKESEPTPDEHKEITRLRAELEQAQGVIAAYARAIAR